VDNRSEVEKASNMGLESARALQMALQSRNSCGGGGGGAAAAAWPIKTELECLLAARQKLHKAVEKTQELGTQINGWENRLRMLKQRHAPLERALAPLQLQADATGGMSSRIERAMTAATSLLKMFNGMHGLERILSKEPQEDFDGYLAAVMQLEEARDYLKHKYTAGVRCLEEAVKHLELDASSNTDSHHLHHLQQSLVSLQAGAHFLASPSIPDCFPFIFLWR
jgi:exocyst complex protein 7